MKSLWVGLAFVSSVFAGWYLSEPAVELPAAEIAEAPRPVMVPAMADPEPEPSDETAIATRRAGLHHLVNADITGPGGNPFAVTLVVDTGATMVVLPNSLIEELGFDETQLREGMAQTARGRVKVKVGELSRIEVGGPQNPVGLHDVEVAFVQDSHLNGVALLGMSFLGRFRVTFDDANDRIILAEGR